jgi:esterase/lipase superfamily enzyme
MVVLALCLAGCAGRPDGVLVPLKGPDVAGASQVDILVATTRSDRAPAGEMFSGERGRLAFADLQVSVPPDAVRQGGEIQWPDALPGNPSKDFVTRRAEHIPPDDARRRFLQRIVARKGRVLVFVHGYNTKFDEAVYRLAQIAHDSGMPHLPVLFTWPSRGKLLAYPYDRESANFSRDGLEQILWVLQDMPQVKEIAILAHSMGNWVTIEALRQMAIRKGRIAPKIASVMLAAPDVDVDVFQRQIVAIGDRRPPFILFTSQNDRALSFSKRVWGSTDRLGSVNPNVEPYRSMLARDKILAIDLSGLKSDDPLGHGTFAQSPEVVRLIGTRLASGQALSENRAGVGDRLGLAVSGALDTVGSAATLAVSAPIAIVDPATRENLGDRIQDLSGKVADTVTLRDVREAVR